jgi:hypothetical protein
MYSLRAIAPYPIKQGARAIWRASQSSDWPTSRMYRLYAVQAIVSGVNCLGLVKEVEELTDGFGMTFHLLL